MAWYDEAVFYHIYPLGLLGAPEHNGHCAPAHRLSELNEWVFHMKDCGFSALYLGPGIPSVYYGSEFGLEGRKERGSDASLRPALSLADLASQENACLQIIRTLGRIHQENPDLSCGEYREEELTTTKYAFRRGDLIVTVTNSDAEEHFDLEADCSYRGALSGREITSENGRLKFTLEENSAEIWIPR